MTLERVRIGNNLPMISNAALHSMSDMGEVVRTKLTPMFPIRYWRMIHLILYTECGYGCRISSWTRDDC